MIGLAFAVILSSIHVTHSPDPTTYKDPAWVDCTIDYVNRKGKQQVRLVYVFFAQEEEIYGYRAVDRTLNPLSIDYFHDDVVEFVELFGVQNTIDGEAHLTIDRRTLTLVGTSGYPLTKASGTCKKISPQSVQGNQI